MNQKTQKKINNIKIWIRLGFSLPDDTKIQVEEHEGKYPETDKTTIQIAFQHNGSRQFEIRRPLNKVSRRDVYKLVEKEVEASGEKRSFLGNIIRFFAWWFGFSGLYAMFAVCPFCGQVGCPVGMGSVGFVGGFFALLMQDWKTMVQFVRTRIWKTSKA